MRDVKWMVSLQHSTTEAPDGSVNTSVYVVHDDDALGAFRTALDMLSDNHSANIYLFAVDTWIHGLDLEGAGIRLTGRVERSLGAVRELSNEELRALLQQHD